MKLTVKTQSGSYDILFERGALNRANEFFKLERRVLIVTDSGVPAQYVDALIPQCKSAHIFSFEQGEGRKNFDTYKAILSSLVEHGFTRTDCVVALGGGVAGDMAGFAASTFMRGIDFYNIPTTVLSQVDSSVGGKTAIDFEGYKNLVGAFYPPKGVLIDFDVLNTLDFRQVSNGMCEAIKMAATFDSELFELFENGEPSFDVLIPRAVKIKRDVVQQDEHESGLRRVLNFGHTLGHAIESEQDENGLIHGECVALGMLAVSSGTVRERLKTVLKKYGLPTNYDGDLSSLMTAMRHDKKAAGDTITVVTCPSIGRFEMTGLDFDTLQNRLEEGFK